MKTAAPDRERLRLSKKYYFFDKGDCGLTAAHEPSARGGRLARLQAELSRSQPGAAVLRLKAYFSFFADTDSANSRICGTLLSAKYSARPPATPTTA